MTEHQSAFHEGAGGAPRHEARDVYFGGIVATGAALLLIIVIVQAITAWMLQVSRQHSAERDALSPNLEMRSGGDSLPPQPRLEGVTYVEQAHGIADSPYEPVAIREQELQTYGWVDQKAGIVRIPIRKAMQRAITDQKVDPQKDPQQKSERKNSPLSEDRGGPR